MDTRPAVQDAEELEVRWALACGLDEAGLDSGDRRVMALIDAVAWLAEAQEAPGALMHQLTAAFVGAAGRLRERP